MNVQIFFSLLAIGTHWKPAQTKFQGYLHQKMFTSEMYSLSRAYSRPNLVHWVLRKIFSLEMVKNDSCLGDASKNKKKAFFSENVPPKNAPMPPMSIICPVTT